MQERPGKSFGPKLTPKSLSDDVAISPPTDFFSFLTQQFISGTNTTQGGLELQLTCIKRVL
jgi:hypothetical protein